MSKGKKGRVKKCECSENGLMLFSLTSQHRIDVQAWLKKQAGWTFDWFNRVWFKPIECPSQAVEEVKSIEALGFTVTFVDDPSTEPADAKAVVLIRHDVVAVRIK